MNCKFGLAVLFCSLAGTAFAGNYTLTIDGKNYDVDTGQQQTIKLSDGRSVKVLLKEKAVVTYRAPTFNFEHASKYAPTSTDLGDGITQTMMATSRDTLITLQEYSAIDPTPFVDYMVNQLTEEEVQTGYQLKTSATQKTLADGTKLAGKKVLTTGGEDEFVRYVLTRKGKRHSLMLITQIEKDAAAEEQQIIEMFWKTLQISLD